MKQLKSDFLESLLELVPHSNEKLNVYSILVVLDKIQNYADNKDTFYDDVKVIMDATDGKVVPKKAHYLN